MRRRADPGKSEDPSPSPLGDLWIRHVLHTKRNGQGRGKATIIERLD